MSDASGPTTPPTLIYANSILSVISFALTFLTLLRVIWSSLETFSNAPVEIHFTLANLKSALFEERELTRRAAHEAHRQHGGRARLYRRRSASKEGGAAAEYDAMTILDMRSTRLFADTVKEFCREFRELERPFLRADVDLGKAGDPHFNHYSEYGIAEFGGFEGDYNSTVGLCHRFMWLRCKGKVINLYKNLQRLQIRRIGLEVAGLQK